VRERLGDALRTAVRESVGGTAQQPIVRPGRPTVGGPSRASNRGARSARHLVPERKPPVIVSSANTSARPH
jgi:hypothetical protein